MYMIWARANMHIPGVKQLGQTNNASPMQLNINPVNIRLENVYLKKKVKPSAVFRIFNFVLSEMK